MAITLADLQKLQELQIKGLTARLEQDIADNLPTDAATLGVIAKILKDNNVTVDPADADQLSQLRNKLKEQRLATVTPILGAARSDLVEKTG